MKRFLLIVLALLVLLLVIVVVYALLPTRTPAIAGVAAATAADAQLIERGRYVAAAGDCAACHTRPGGKPFAGGLPVASPIGTIYSTNITPDPEHGIGGWTLDQFNRAVRHGIMPNGGTLYPAMPYPSYSRINDEDVRALHAFFMHGVQPVAEPNRPSDIRWPLSIRWPLAIWRKTFAPSPDSAGWDAARYADPKLARGAYLVQGLGHCGACHTPRAFTLQEKALDESGADFLAGGQVIDGWVAVNLRGNTADGLGRWSEQDLVDTLRSARNPRAAVVGQPMGDVVVHSTQWMTDEDLRAIAGYLKTLPATAGGNVSYAASDTTAKALRAGVNDSRGAELYVDNCAACHHTDAEGAVNALPAIAGNPTVLAPQPTTLVRLILAGSSLPSTQKAPSNLGMPGFAWRLNDDEVAQLATYVRGNFGNHAPAVSAAQVREVRQSLEEVPRDAKAAAEHDPTGSDSSDK